MAKEGSAQKFNKAHNNECVFGVTYLFSVEVAVLVTVGYWDGEEIVVCAGIGCQSVQRSLQLSAAWSLWESFRFDVYSHPQSPGRAVNV